MDSQRSCSLATVLFWRWITLRKRSHMPSSDDHKDAGSFANSILKSRHASHTLSAVAFTNKTKVRCAIRLVPRCGESCRTAWINEPLVSPSYLSTPPKPHRMKKAARQRGTLRKHIPERPEELEEKKTQSEFKDPSNYFAVTWQDKAQCRNFFRSLLSSIFYKFAKHNTHEISWQPANMYYCVSWFIGFFQLHRGPGHPSASSACFQPILSFYSFDTLI